MYDYYDVINEKDIDPDAAIMQVLAQTEKGLFDTDDSKDEDLEALYER